MQGVYTATAQISAVTTAKTLMYLTAPADMVIEVLSAKVTNVDNDTNEQTDISIGRIAYFTTDGPQGTAVTPQPMEAGSVAASATVGANAVEEPTYSNDVDREGVSSVGGYRFEPTPEERLYVSPGQSIGLRLRAAITSTGLQVQMTFREIGG